MVKRLAPETRLSVGWALAGVLLAFFTGPLMAVFSPFLVIPLWMGYAAIGAAIALLCLVALWKAGTAGGRRGSLAGLVVVLGTTAALWFGGLFAAARAGDGLFFQVRFARLLPTYERIAAELNSVPPLAELRGQRHGIRYEVDPGPPLRIVFPQPGGIIDNWEGVIFDPSHAVAAAHGWDDSGGEQRFTAPPHVKKLFGGDIVWCKHIRAAWYRCSFT